MRTEQIRRAYREMDAIEVTTESDDGLVEVSVGGRGELRSLWVDPRVYRSRDAEALAASIVAAMRDAAAEAARRAFYAAIPLLPPGAVFEETDLVFDPVLYELDRLVGSEERRDG